MKQDNEKSIKGIRIRLASFYMMVLSVLLFGFVLYSSHQIALSSQALTDTTDEFIFCEENAVQISDGSDYLTEQVRLYVLTGELTYANNYFTELYTTQRREEALAALYDVSTDQADMSYLQAAVDESDQLALQEIYAIKLMALAQDADLTQFPETVQELLLDEEDAKLSLDEMLSKAQEIVFTSDYEDSKAYIVENISSFITSATQNTRTEQQQQAERLEKLSTMQTCGVISLFIINILNFALIIMQVTRPLRFFIQHIQKDEAADICGCYECRYLAATYNNMLQANLHNQELLRHRAEHDALTGLLNRGAYEHSRQLLQGKTDPLAFLLIDIDQFKHVNDTYGHEIGDQVLQRVSHLLLTGFRSNDMVMRLGGDEFGVIMMKMTPENKDTIEQKIESFNQLLQHDSVDLPGTTLTVGVAFSPAGFNDELFSHADQALYQRKENGRCGCQFYEPPTTEKCEADEA